MAPTSAKLMTDCHTVLCWSVVCSGQCKQRVAIKCIIQFRYVTEAFSLYSDIPVARCLSPRLLLDVALICRE